VDSDAANIDKLDLFALIPDLRDIIRTDKNGNVSVEPPGPDPEGNI
jgi:hypothetical protein